jgi:membrane-bound metal-dependent hydrolase YbcI (DUF457 family)
MFAVGHLAIGYLTAKTLAKILQTEIDIPTILMLSIIPDMDLLIPQLLHRGPTHSLIITTFTLIPAFLMKGKSVLPYFGALTQHSTIGDFLTGDGVTAFWPLSSRFYGLGVNMLSLTNTFIEGSSFLMFLALIILSKDLRVLLNPKKTSPLLIFPLGGIFPAIIGRLATPNVLLIPHFILFVIFTIALTQWIKRFVVENMF